ncbi:hypothetical protein K474DRAFT_640923 [Panus rudis PR-1116 ss-1]|nr:hypothetical protein K474DRAFT_640923 [Panus rudis PR-1116 ss-1]
MITTTITTATTLPLSPPSQRLIPTTFNTPSPTLSTANTPQPTNSNPLTTSARKRTQNELPVDIHNNLVFFFLVYVVKDSVCYIICTCTYSDTLNFASWLKESFGLSFGLFKSWTVQTPWPWFVKFLDCWINSW